MSKLKKLEEKINKGVFTHEQHTGKFNQELNKPKDVVEPFRITDGIWKIGKYRGSKIDNTPVNYISWVLKNIPNLSLTHKNILQGLLDN